MLIADKVSPRHGEWGNIQLLVIPYVPGLVTQGIVYHAGAAATWPLHLAFEALPDAVWESTASDRDHVKGLEARMPYVSPRQYRRLVALSGRSYVLSYRREFEEFDVWRCLVGIPLFLWGKKPKLAGLVCGEWRNWQTAGRPAGGEAEARFVLSDWIVRWNRGPDASRPYKPEEVRIMEDLLGASSKEVKQYWGENAKTGEKWWERPSPWKFWVQAHGGVDAIVHERFKDDSPAERATPIMEDRGSKP
jgi:hypothetical protein